MSSAKVVFSLGCFWDWIDSPESAGHVEDTLLQLCKHVDGFELHCNHDDLEGWSNSIKYPFRRLPPPFSALSRQVAEQILNLPHNTLHLSDMKFLPAGNEQWLADQLARVYSRLGISDFTVHPDEVAPSRWRTILNYLPEEVTLSVENMDFRKRNYHSLLELSELLSQYPKLKCTFDICHWLEAGNELLDLELFAFLTKHKAQLSKIHFSVPHSEHAIYKSRGDILHKLAVHSSTLIPDRFIDLSGAESPWVIEGYVPRGCLLDALAEVELVRSLLERATVPFKQVVG